MKLAQKLLFIGSLAAGAAAPACKTPDTVAPLRSQVATQLHGASEPPPDEPHSASPAPTGCQESYETRLAEFHSFERLQRDLLFADLESEGLGRAIGLMLYGIPERESVHVRNAPGKRQEKSLLHRLFDLAVGSKADELYFSLVEDDRLARYHREVYEAAESLQLPGEVTEAGSLTPFYESVRNPSDDDLKRFYNFVRDNGVARTVIASIPKGTFDQAKKLIKRNPRLCVSTDFTDQCDAQNLTSDTPYSRKANGELVSEIADEFADEEDKKTSPFIKFLFRRGEKFTSNAHAMVHSAKVVGKKFGTADEFVEMVRKWIPPQQESVNR